MRKSSYITTMQYFNIIYFCSKYVISGNDILYVKGLGEKECQSAWTQGLAQNASYLIV